MVSSIGPRIPLRLEVSYPELNRKMMEPVDGLVRRRWPTAGPAGGPQQQHRLISLVSYSGVPEDEQLELPSALLQEVVDLTPYVNTSAMQVPRARG